MRGKPTLLIDLDPQGNSSMSYLDIRVAGKSMYDVFVDSAVRLTDVIIQTPLETMNSKLIDGKKLVFVPILRAGMGMLDGVLSLIPVARVGFIGLYRNEETLQPVEYYVKLPNDIAERDVILLDPMLATGNSTAAAVTTVKAAGAHSVRLIALIAAPEGIERLHREYPDVAVVVAGIDRGLNERGYILPGLGDAGDRLFGTK